MAKSNVKLRPKISGTLIALGAWQSLFARSGYRIYPYQLGAMVRADSNGTAIESHGLGEMLSGDYIVICRSVQYGEAPLYIPDMSKIRRISNFGDVVTSTDPAQADDDIINITEAVAVVAGDYILCLGADNGLLSDPLAPNFDGSLVTLYTDNAGNETNAYRYMLTGQGGWYNGWTQSGIVAVDLLVCNSGNTPVVIMPDVAIGPEVV
jgi:hypothetical protein